MKNSKLIILVVLVVVAVILGVSYFMGQDDSSEPTSTNDSSNTTDTNDDQVNLDRVVDPQALVKNAFTEYLQEFANDPASALEGFKQYTTDGVAAQLDSEGATNLIFCAQNAPSEQTFTDPSSANGATIMTVTNVFESGTSQTVVGVNAEAAKITSLSCQ